MTGSVFAALLISATPAIASAEPSGAASAAASAAAGAGNVVQSFYEARRNAPLWLRGAMPTPAALQLIGRLKQSQLDGFTTGPELAARSEAALARARSGDPAAVMEAEFLLSSAWVAYAQALGWPAAGMEYGDQYLSPRIQSPEEILQRAAHAPSLDQHVRTVASVNPIYAQLRDAGLRELQANGTAPSPALIANLERARSLPAGGRFILVDIATARLWMYEDGQPRDSMKVIVGKPEMQTPMIASTIHYATFNPYWHVPADMVRRLIAPNVLKQGQSYLRTRGYQVVTGYTDDAQIIPADSVDWKAVAAGRQELWVRQLPGGGNSMGEMKFSFPNATGIYLHDTPQKDLFAKSQRALSGGCIRLEDAQRLARWLLGRDPAAPSANPESHVQLPEGVPIYVTYLTAQPGESGVEFADDVYGLDRAPRSLASSQ